MERELWRQLYELALRFDEAWKIPAVYPTSMIVAVFFWAVIHDRPVSWACQRRNWPPDIQLALPSQSTMSRRLRTPAVENLLSKIFDELSEHPRTWFKSIDAKPLVIGGYTKDKDAAWGYAVKSFAKGYKLYAIWGEGSLPLVWGLAPMNVSEKRMAAAMIPHLTGSGYLLGDTQYDTNPLYDLAQQNGHQLVAPRYRRKAGLGHRYNSPSRLRSIELLKTRFGTALYRQREDVERRFGWLTSCATGLTVLPAWVRRPTRVRLWIYAKLLINALRLEAKKPKQLDSNYA
jgi:hypothetical protein